MWYHMIKLNHILEYNMSDEILKKIEKFEKEIESNLYDEDTVAAIACIQGKKASILNSVYGNSLYKRNEAAMKNLLSHFPKADKYIIEKELVKIGLPTKNSSKRKLRMWLYLIMIPITIFAIILTFPLLNYVSILICGAPAMFLYYVIYEIACIEINHHGM